MWLSHKLKNSKDYKTDYHEEMVELIGKKSPLLDLLEQVRSEQTSAIENYLKLRIRPKPFYLPKLLWKFILSKLVYLQYFKA